LRAASLWVVPAVATDSFAVAAEAQTDYRRRINDESAVPAYSVPYVVPKPEEVKAVVVLRSGKQATPEAIIAVASPLGAPSLLGAIARRAPHQFRLTAYLSGDEDGESDYPIPLISFGLNKRSGAPSYYSISVPFSPELIEAFTDRPNGIVHVWRDGTPWETFNIAHPVRYDRGPRSASISVAGTRQVTLAAAASIPSSSARLPA